MSVKLHNIMIYTGYVESNSWSALCFNHDIGFESVEEMIQHLSQCILEGDELDKKYAYVPQCCKNNTSKTAKYCPTCGSLLEKEEINREYYAELIRDLQFGTFDSVAHTIWEVMERDGWVLWGDSRLKTTDFANVVILQENGELLMAKCAFGRIFDETSGGLNQTPEKEKRKDISRKILLPKKAKLVID